MSFSIIHALFGAAAVALAIEATPISYINSSPNPRSLAKRELLVTSINCGTFSTADNIDTWKGASDLMSKTDSVNIGANSCGRIGCYNYAGAYICNDQDVDIAVPINEAGNVVNQLGFICSSGGEGHKSISGQAFINDLGGYNVVVAFCDPQDDSLKKPSDYLDLGYAPSVTCGDGEGQTPCDSGTCSQEPVIDSFEEDVKCNTYMASTYTNAGGSLTYSQSRTLTTGWTLGGSLGINLGDAPFVGVLQFTGSYSNFMSVGTVTGSIGTCGQSTGTDGKPGNWTCGTLVEPSCYKVSGTCETAGGLVLPYEVQTPKDNGTEGYAVTVQSICTCQNCPGWADVGAPLTLCPMDCATCQ